jgi:hypothetical protein
MTFIVLFISPSMGHLLIKYILPQDPSSIPSVSKGGIHFLICRSTSRLDWTVVWQQSLHGVLRLVLFDEFACTHLIKASNLCGVKCDLYLTIFQLLNMEFYSPVEFFFVMVCRLFFLLQQQSIQTPLISTESVVPEFVQITTFCKC